MSIYLKRALRNKQFMLLFALGLLMIIAVVFAQNFAPHDPYKQYYDHILENSSAMFPLGTDQLGRCVLSRLMYAGKTSLLTVFAIVIVSALIGSFIGIVSAMSGGIVDSLIMRFLDMLMAFPGMVLIIALVAVFGVGVFNIFIALIVTSWVSYARFTRSVSMSIIGSDFIHEARLGGANNFKIMYAYILPNILPQLLVLMTQDLGDKLLTLASLSLLGLGAQPPQPEWGFMLSEGKPFMQTCYWLLIYPGLIILINVVIFNLLGDSLRDILDPKYEN